MIGTWSMCRPGIKLAVRQNISAIIRQNGPALTIVFNAVPMLQSKGEPLDIIGLEPLEKLLTVILQHLISPPIVFALHG